MENKINLGGLAFEAADFRVLSDDDGMAGSSLSAYAATQAAKQTGKSICTHTARLVCIEKIV